MVSYIYIGSDVRYRYRSVPSVGSVGFCASLVNLASGYLLKFRRYEAFCHFTQPY
eukprot:SAG31_NODE_324_length_17691_cov_8.128126_5_plen_55_part_00